LTSIPIIVGSTMSAVFITTVNAWMNTPTGFSVKNGIFSNIHPLEAMLNPAMPTKVAHVLSSAYLTGAFLLAAIAAYHMVKGPRHVYFQKTLRLTMVSGFILAIATLIAGDLSGKFLAEHQPEKLAAAEWHFDTQQRAPLVLGGMLDPKTLEVRYGIQIPLALSILAKGSTNGEVKGLNDIPRHLWPPLFVHYLFDMMVAIGFYLIFISAVFLFLWAKKEGNEWHPWVMRGIVAGAPLSFLAIELGWIYAEVGRQPWMIRGIMTVKEGVTTSGHTLPVFLIFTFLYSVLGIIAMTVLNRLFRNKTPESEMADRNIIL
jgi:cytochrome d ubiquinol oxidase subunit I